MRKEFEITEYSKCWVLLSVLVACFMWAFFINYVMGISVVYTHLFYVPILLAGMWYQKKAVYVAIFFGLLHISLTYLSSDYFEVWSLGRAAIFILVAYTIGYVSEKRAKEEKKLKASEEKYSAFFKTSRDPVFITSKDGRVIEINDATVELFGYETRDELRKMRVPDLYENPEDWENYFRLLGRQRFAQDYPINLRKKDGSIVNTITTFVAREDENGNVIGYQGTIRDITERKRAEKERERLLNELGAKNAELERFTFTVSHDLASPLFAIRGFATLAREDLEQGNTENLASDFDRIESAAAKMDLLLKDTLKLSRIGRVANPPEDVPFGDIVEEALEQTAGELKATQIDVSVAEDFPTVHVDRMRIVEVLVNLITNSIKYRGDQPHPEIEIGYRVDDKDTVFFVKDNGIGIDKSQYKKVFELFYQVDKSIEGTGAGLASVKRILEVHGGRIWIESEKGEGCTVCFTLPVSP